MVLTTARLALVRCTRTATDTTSYTTVDQDLAFMFGCNPFVNATYCVSKDDAVDLSEGDNDFDFSAITPLDPVTGRTLFTAEDSRDLYISDAATNAPLGEVAHVDRSQIIKLQICNPGVTGIPTMIGWNGSKYDGLLYPTPDKDYVLNASWRPPFTVWTPGTASPDNVTLNIPDRFLYPLIETIVAARLQRFEKDKVQLNAQREAAYEKFLSQNSSAGSIGGKSIQRSRLE